MTQKHEHWSSKLGFILATAGSAVGLGALWRFPYVAGTNGGGAFVLIYLLLTVCIGYPIFLAELIIGRKTQKSAVLAYSSLRNNSENWRGLGWLNFLTCLIILSFYGVISGWVLSYCFMSLTNFTDGKSPEEIRSVFVTLYKSPWINIFWFALFLTINFGVVCSGVKHGIEKWAKILMPGLFIILLGMFFYVMTLPGFTQALHFVFYPDFANLGKDGLLNALGMALFTLSVGYGIIVTYGSYMQKSDNITKNGLYVAIMTICVSLISAMVIFPIVFTNGLSPEQGPGLIFKTLPMLFAKMPATILISTVFFLLVLFASLTSTISLLEVLVANMMEVFDIERKKAALYLSLLAFFVGIPSALAGSGVLFPNWEQIYGSNFFDMMDNIALNWFTPIAALISVIFVGWLQKKDTYIKEFTKGSNQTIAAHIWYFVIKFIAPVVLVSIICKEAGIVSA